MLICSVVFHEVGHCMYFQHVLHRQVHYFLGVIPGRGTCLRVGDERDYKGLSGAHRCGVYLSGIAAGMIPIFIIVFYDFAYGVLFVPYMAGCWRDIKNFWRCSK